MSAKILILDIETAPFESYTWGLWDQNIGLNQIKTETSLLSFAAKWLHNTKIMYMDTSGNGAEKVREDWLLLDALRDLLDEADIVVAQNGASFDVKRINARMAMLGLLPYSPIRIVDTLLVAKKHFAFSSNKLEWLGQYLAGQGKYKSKKFEGMDLWKECLKDNPVAWAEMKKYNILDTKLCERVYLALRPWIDQHPNLGAYVAESKPICPKCGSDKVEGRGQRYTQQGMYERYCCQECGGWSRGKIMLLPPKKRRSMLA